MQFFINEKMVEIIDDIFCLSNFMQYQNQDGLERIREKNRERQARFRENQKLNLLQLKNSNVTDNVTSHNSSLSKSNSISNSLSMLEEYSFTDRVKDSIANWLKYKKERKQTYKDTGLKTLLNKIAKWVNDYGEEAVIENINNSISNNWSGVFEPTAKTTKKPPIAEIPKYSNTNAEDAFARALERSFQLELQSYGANSVTIAEADKVELK